MQLRTTLGPSAVLVFCVGSAGPNAQQRTEAQDIYKSLIEKARPELLRINERDDEILFVSQHSSKPLVGSIPI